jgi:O-antigen/teichoic acid export membrane protein
MRESLTSRTLKGAAWIGGASVARLALRVISVAILARLLTPHEYGVVAGALVAMDLAAMVYLMGLAPTLIQRKEVRPDHVATAFSSALFMAVLAAAGMWFAAPLFADLMHIPELTQILKVLACLTPFGAFSILCEALLARNMQVKSAALRPLFSFTISTFLVAIPMAWYGFGYWSLVAVQVVDTLVTALALGIAARRLLVRPHFSRRAFAELWPLSFGFSLNQPFVYLAENADRFLIGRLLGTGPLGLYTRASVLTTTASTVFGNITRLSVFPAMTQVQGDVERLRGALLKTLAVVALLTLPLSVFCITFASELVNLLLGAHWGGAVVPFAVLSGALYFRLAWRGCGAVFQALGRPHVISAVHAFRAVALILGIWYAAAYGLNAICGVVLVVMALVSVTMLIMATRAIGLSFGSIARVHLRPVAISAVVLGTGMSLKMRPVDAPAAMELVTTLAVLAAFIAFNIRSMYSPPASSSGVLRAKRRQPTIDTATPRLTLTRKERA